jgi:hypothetical protein
VPRQSRRSKGFTVDRYRMPLLLASLLAIRAIACSDGSASNPATHGQPIPDGGIPAPVCEAQGGATNGTIIYYALLADGTIEQRTHACRSSCFVDSFGGPGCWPVDGELPFRYCTMNTDCTNSSYCESASAPSHVVLGSGECRESACDWRSKTPELCPGGTRCVGTTCGGIAGATSGGFPWAGNNGSGGAPNRDGG